MSVGHVPLFRRFIRSDQVQIAASVVVVGVAIALVLLLVGLRNGMGVQATRYVLHQPGIFVGQRGTTNFMSQTSVLPAATAARVARVDGVRRVDEVSQEFAMLHLHGRRIVALLVGADPGRAGGPWSLAAGRPPRESGDVVVDEAMADDHAIRIASTLEYRGERLVVVGLSRQTSGFMLPAMFTTRTTLNALNGRPGTATFLLVTPAHGTDAGRLARRIEHEVGGVSALPRTEIARNDRSLLVGAFNGPLLAMVAIAAAVAALVIALTVLSATSARTRDLATLKALGMRAGELGRAALAQAIFIALGGIIFGILTASVVALAVNDRVPRYLIAIPSAAMTTTVVAALAMAVSGAALPMWIVSKLDPAEAFRR